MKTIKIYTCLIIITLFAACKKKDEAAAVIKIREASFECTFKLPDIYNVSAKTYRLTGPFHNRGIYDRDMTLPENDRLYSNDGPQINPTKPGYILLNGSSESFYKTYPKTEDALVNVFLSNNDDPITVKDYVSTSNSTLYYKDNILTVGVGGANSFINAAWLSESRLFYHTIGMIQLKGDYTKVSIKEVQKESDYTYYSGTFEIKFSYVNAVSVGALQETAIATGSFKNLRIQTKP